MKIVATTSLPVDRPTADRWNAARSRQKLWTCNFLCYSVVIPGTISLQPSLIERLFESFSKSGSERTVTQRFTSLRILSARNPLAVIWDFELRRISYWDVP